MSRYARAQSESGYYHVVQVGAGRQVLFEDDSDRLKYVDILRSAKTDFQFALIAWCLMSNHVHLILKSDYETLSKCMHAIGSKYASYFNYAKGHQGPVFQGRFYSEPVETDEHLLAAVRYVHNNPEKAGVSSRESYVWGSYRGYFGGTPIADVDLVLEMIGGRAAFAEFSKLDDSFESSIDEDKMMRGRLNDDEAAQLGAQIASPIALAELKGIDVRKRNEIVRRMKSAGIQGKQIQRLTGLGLSTISRA